MNTTDPVALRTRRSHEKQGCCVSPSGIYDGRCGWCKDFDSSQQLETRLGFLSLERGRRVVLEIVNQARSA